MKRSAILCFTGLVILGAILALRMDAPSADVLKTPAPQAAAAPIADPQPAPPTIAASKETAPLPAATPPDAAQIEELRQKLAAQQAEYEFLRESALRTRAEWKKRWAADTATMAAELAAVERSVAAQTQDRKEAEAHLQEVEARLRESITATKAEAEQEKRERAEQAAAPPPAPQQASDS